jgi:hypothetical protein
VSRNSRFLLSNTTDACTLVRGTLKGFRELKVDAFHPLQDSIRRDGFPLEDPDEFPERFGKPVQALDVSNRKEWQWSLMCCRRNVSAKAGTVGRECVMWNDVLLPPNVRRGRTGELPLAVILLLAMVAAGAEPSAPLLEEDGTTEFYQKDADIVRLNDLKALGRLLEEFHQRQAQALQGQVAAFDAFDGQLGLKWDTLNPVASHWSRSR